MKRNLVILLLLFNAFNLKANVRDTIPNGIPANIFHSWVENIKQFASDSGIVMYKNDDTTAKPKSIYSAIKFLAGKPYYWDGTGWRGFAVPITGFVQYSDSATLYVTLTRLKDSLGNYVTLHTTQSVSGAKTWDSDAVFNDSASFNSVLKNTVPSRKQSRFTYTDSVKFIDPDGTFFFGNRINGLNDSYKSSKAVGTLITGRQRLLLNKQQDTLLLKGYNSSAINITNTFLRQTNSDDTLKVTSTNSTDYLKSISTGIEATSDTSLAGMNTPYWKLDIPYAGILTYAAVTNNGVLKEFDDINLGSTSYLKSGGDSAFHITKRVGLNIQNIAGNAINQNSYAIIQQGGSDSVYFHSADIKLDNLKTSLTPAFYVLQDANGNVLKKAYLPPVAATLDFPSTAAQTSSDLTVTVTGAAVGDIATVSWGNAPDQANSDYVARVSAANTVTVRFNNYSAGSINPTSGSFTVLVTPQ